MEGVYRVRKVILPHPTLPNSVYTIPYVHKSYDITSLLSRPPLFELVKYFAGFIIILALNLCSRRGSLYFFSLIVYFLNIWKHIHIVNNRENCWYLNQLKCWGGLNYFKLLKTVKHIIGKNLCRLVTVDSNFLNLLPHSKFLSKNIFMNKIKAK